MFDRLNILMVCKESYSYPMYYLARILKKNNRVAAYFVEPVETKTRECIYNKYTYYKFVKEADIEVYDCNNIADEFTKNINSPLVTDDEINYLERNYTSDRGINVQLLSSQIFSTAYHNRTYMKPSSHLQQLYWLFLNIKNCERILDDFKPDVILDIDYAEIGRTALHEVSNRKGIPYITMGFSRFEQYKYFTFTHGLEANEYFQKAYEKNLHLKDSELSAEREYVNQFRKSAKIMSSEYKGTVTARYKADKLIDTLKRSTKSLIFALDTDWFRGKKGKLRKQNKILYTSSIEIVKLSNKYELKRRYLYKTNHYFEAPISGEKYIYMPLHLIPESSTLVGAPFFINELTIIEAVSKSLPAGVYLYVKEHQSMLGERAFSFYKKIKELPNVKLVQMNYYTDPKPWIVNSLGVITITGTSGYEAAMLGKPAFVFGDVIYNIIQGVIRVRSFEDLPELFRGIKDVENTHSCAAYIKTVKQLGEEINIFTLLYGGNQAMVHQSEPDKEFYQNINNLKKLFEMGYVMYKGLNEKNE